MTMKIISVQPTQSPLFLFDERFAKGCRGDQLFLRVAQLSSPPRAEVILTHGLGEHSGRYGHVAQALAEKGMRLWAYDLRAHGRSPGRRGDAPDYQLFLDDLACIVEQVPSGPAPVFMMGHSLGGQITLNYLLRHQGNFRGAIIASPWL